MKRYFVVKGQSYTVNTVKTGQGRFARALSV